MNDAEKLGAYVLRVLRREPVALGAALGAWIMAAKWDDLVESAAILTIAWVVRSLSTPTAKVDEVKTQAEAVGYAKALDDVNSLGDQIAVATMPEPSPSPMQLPQLGHQNPVEPPPPPSVRIAEPSDDETL